MSNAVVAVDDDARTKLVALEAAILEQERDKLMALQGELEKLPQVDCPLEHYFADGQYGRVITMPKGAVVVGKIHLHGHLNILIKGRCTVVTPTGMKELRAGDVFVSEPGTKRAVYNHTETRWMTVHNNPSETRNLEQLEREVIASTFQEYDEKRAMTYSREPQRISVRYQEDAK